MIDIFYIRRRGGDLAFADLSSLDLDSDKLPDGFIYRLSSLIDRDEEARAARTIGDMVSSVVTDWIQEKRYILRLLVSAVIFVLVYLICSLAIRDPIPMVDELLIAFGCAAASYILIARNDGKASVAIKKRQRLLDAVRKAVFDYSDSILEIEKTLEALDDEDQFALLRRIASSSLGKADVSQAFRNGFSAWMRMYRHDEWSAARRIEAGKLRGERLERKLLHDADARGLDIPLIAFSLMI